MKMNIKRLLGLLCSLGVSANAGAACPSNPSDIQITDISALLTDHTVCVGIPGNWEAQEYHQNDGKLIDYKHGPKEPKAGRTGIGPWNDWTDQVGNWSVAGTQVNYDYNRDGNTDFSFSVYRTADDTKYYFCNTDTTVAIDSIIPGLVSCD